MKNYSLEMQWLPIWFFIILIYNLFWKWFLACSLRGSACLGSIEAFKLLLFKETISLFVPFLDVVCGVHLEKVKPAISFFALKVLRVNFNTYISVIVFWARVRICRLYLVIWFFIPGIFPSVAGPLILSVNAWSWLVMIIAHGRYLIVLLIG